MQHSAHARLLELPQNPRAGLLTHEKDRCIRDALWARTLCQKPTNSGFAGRVLLVHRPALDARLFDVDWEVDVEPIARTFERAEAVSFLGSKHPATFDPLAALIEECSPPARNVFVAGELRTPALNEPERTRCMVAQRPVVVPIVVGRLRAARGRARVDGEDES